MNFAKWVYRIAGIAGLAILFPIYFLEDRIGIDLPPRITHPEFFYGFVGVALAWQVAFLLVSTNPTRYRPLMPACMLEKFSYVLGLALLWASGRLPSALLPSLAIDLALGFAFFAAYLATPIDSDSSIRNVAKPL